MRDEKKLLPKIFVLFFSTLIQIKKGRRRRRNNNSKIRGKKEGKNKEISLKYCFFGVGGGGGRERGCSVSISGK